LFKLSRHSDIAITPDGPKGPLYQVQVGIIELARLTALPIIPVTFSSSSRKILKSWDQFMIPGFFSKGVFIWGNPIFVDKGATPAQVEMKREELEHTLNEITKEADNYF
jgi:hypothetical protein